MKTICRSFNNYSNDFDFLVNEYFIESPSYNPNLDISVVNKDGAHAATCIGWADYDNSIAEIENSMYP